MNNFITRNLRQQAVIWLSNGIDGYGNPTWAAPVPIKVRWEERIERTLDSSGNEILSKAYVYMAQKYDVGSYVYLGTSIATAPPTGSFEVVNFQSIPNIRNSFSEHKATL